MIEDVRLVLRMSFDRFMNDTCSKCRKPMKLAVVTQHALHRDPAVYKSECANCGAVKARVLFRKRRGIAA